MRTDLRLVACMAVAEVGLVVMNSLALKPMLHGYRASHRRLLGLEAGGKDCRADQGVVSRASRG